MPWHYRGVVVFFYPISFSMKFITSFTVLNFLIAELGISKLIVTAAVGAINENYKPGDIMAVNDHIKLTTDCPLRGKNPDSLGPRYFDMSKAYDADLLELANSAALNCGLDIKNGVYAYMGGPNFETPAEIKMLKILHLVNLGIGAIKK